jgi:hypothetical protein
MILCPHESPPWTESREARPGMHKPLRWLR